MATKFEAQKEMFLEIYGPKVLIEFSRFHNKPNKPLIYRIGGKWRVENKDDNAFANLDCALAIAFEKFLELHPQYPKRLRLNLEKQYLYPHTLSLRFVE
jgi:hypothetical protein